MGGDPGAMGQQVGDCGTVPDLGVEIESPFFVGDERGQGGQKLGHRCKRERSVGWAPGVHYLITAHKSGSAGRNGPGSELIERGHADRLGGEMPTA